MSKIIAIDFDGTLCVSAWPDIGAPMFDVIDKAKAEQQNGAKLILWTCRNGELLENAIAWCKSFGLVFDAVNANLPERLEMYGTESRKVSADEYWDDKAIAFPEKNCLSCSKRKETQGKKQRVYSWCVNSCKNYKAE